jgi:putative transcriptional regulator
MSEKTTLEQAIPNDELQHRPAVDLRCLQQAGLDFVCPEHYSAEAIKALRARLGVSQAVLAVALNTSRGAVRQWEQGVRSPTGSALRLLQLLDKRGMSALLC